MCRPYSVLVCWLCWIVRVDLREGDLRGPFPAALLRLSNLSKWQSMCVILRIWRRFWLFCSLCCYSERLELTLNVNIDGPLPTELGTLSALGKSNVILCPGVLIRGIHLTLFLSSSFMPEFLGIGRMRVGGKLPTELGLLSSLGTHFDLMLIAWLSAS